MSLVVKAKSRLIFIVIPLAVFLITFLINGNFNKKEFDASQGHKVHSSLSISTLAAKPKSNRNSQNISQFKTGLENLPPSLTGTIPDGQLLPDSSGNLIISNQVRLTFEYFLSGLGEEPLDILVARIEAYIADQLEEPAASQARDILNHYLALKEALANMDQPTNSFRFDVDKMSALLEQVKDLRRTYLSQTVADAFFREEESYDQYSLNTIKILQDQNLSEREQEQQINNLKQQLPEAMQTALSETQKVVEMDKSIELLDKERLSKTELYNLRSEYVGSEAAERLAILDEERDQWKQQLQTWLSVRDEILNDQNIADQDKTALTNQLRTDYFEDKDIRRVEALERIHDDKQSTI